MNIINAEYLIIGGGIAGITAAETIRSKDKEAKIAIVEQEPYFLYSRVMLPKYIKGEVAVEDIMLRNLSDYEKNKIDIYLSEYIVSLDMAAKRAHTLSGKIFEFEKLLVASGGRVKNWQSNLEELHKDFIFRLQSLDDARRLKKFLTSKKRGRAIVVGGGFIALEFIKILLAYNFDTVFIHRGNKFWEKKLDSEGHSLMRNILEKNKIEIVEKDEIIAIAREDKEMMITTEKRRQFKADLICVGIGLDKNCEFLQGICNADIKGVITDECLKTTNQNIWAAGDVAYYKDIIAGDMKVGGNWASAFVQGRVAGLNMLGENIVFENVSSYSIEFLGNAISFLGFVGEEEKIETITRLNSETRQYTRFFIKNNQIIGAILINALSNMGPLVNIIKSKKDISQFKAKLQNPHFDIKKLL